VLEDAVGGAPGVAFLRVGVGLLRCAVLFADEVAVVALPVVRVAHAHGRDRAARMGVERGADAPVRRKGVAAAQLDLVAVVVGQRAVAAVIDERVVEVLRAAGIAEVGVGVDRAFGVALAP